MTKLKARVLWWAWKAVDSFTWWMEREGAFPHRLWVWLYWRTEGKEGKGDRVIPWDFDKLNDELSRM